MFAVCFFHACVLVRYKYQHGLEAESNDAGECAVTEHDLALSIETIRACVTEADERNEEVSFLMLQYTIEVRRLLLPSIGQI